MTENKQNFSIKVELYDTFVGVILSKQAMKEWLIEKEEWEFIGHLDSNPVALNLEITTSNGEWFNIIYLPGVKNLVTISHEVIHAAWNILYKKGIMVDYHNHEALTYLHDFILNKILEEINKQDND